MALPTAGNGIRAEAQVLPSASLTDFTLLIDLSQIPAARLAHLFSDVNTADGTRGRISDLSNNELPLDWNDLVNQANPGHIRTKYTGSLPTTGTIGVIIYSPNTRNTAYGVSDTFGQHNAYDANIVAYLPLTSDFNDRTSFSNSATGSGGIGAGDSSGKVGASTRFDGIGDYLTITNSASLQIDGDITLSLVANDDVMSSTRALIYKTYQNAEYYLKLNSSDQLIYVQEFVDNTISSAISSSTWHQIVGKKDSNTLYGNIDGVDQGFAITTTATGTGTTNVQIGQEDGFFRFAGYMQHIFIHNVARSNAWIAEENAQINNNSTFWGNWSDITVGGTIYNVTCTETKLETDTTGSALFIQVSASDGINNIDSDHPVFEIPVTALDALTISDAVTALTEISAVITETINYIDLSTTEKAPIDVICGDLITLQAVTNGVFEFNAICPDGLGLVDYSQAVALIVAASVEGINYSDIAIETSQVAQGLVKIVGESSKLSIIFNVVAKPTITGGN